MAVQTNGPAYQAARAEHIERLRRLEAVQQEVLTVYRAITRASAEAPPCSTDEVQA
jgi:hypothetical protein